MSGYEGGLLGLGRCMLFYFCLFWAIVEKSRCNMANSVKEGSLSRLSCREEHQAL